MATSITEEMIDDAIRSVQYHHFPGTQVIACCITLTNGFSVLGTANAHNPSAFKISTGREIAKDMARDKIAPLLSYAVRERLHRAKMPELHSINVGEVHAISYDPDDPLQFD